VAVVPASGTAVLAKKQLYANHYLEGALDMLAIVDVGTSAGGSARAPHVYVILMRRFRFDNLPVGFFNVRGRVRSQLIDRTRTDLTRTRTAIDKPVSPSGGG